MGIIGHFLLVVVQCGSLWYFAVFYGTLLYFEVLHGTLLYFEVLVVLAEQRKAEGGQIPALCASPAAPHTFS